MTAIWEREKCNHCHRPVMNSIGSRELQYCLEDLREALEVAERKFAVIQVGNLWRARAIDTDDRDTFLLGWDRLQAARAKLDQLETLLQG